MEPKTLMSKELREEFPPFDLTRLLKTVFDPKPGETVAILIDLKNPSDVKEFAFLKQNLPIQKRAYEIFYQGIKNRTGKELKLGNCSLFAYEMTGGSNLELPKTAVSSEGKIVNIESDIYKNYDLILCISTYSATAPLTAAAKKFGFRGSTMHGLNDIILKSGLAVDYNEVSVETERLRKAMTKADSADIKLAFKGKSYHLHIDLGKQEAQKSHGLCRVGPDIANLPAGEVYFVPKSAEGEFPIKFEEDGTIGLMHVANGRVDKATLLQGNQATVDRYNAKFKSDPAAGILGELGFGTQVLPFANADIQDEKIFGTFHLATGRNDHLSGTVTLDKFREPKNATHDDILFSATKTNEIELKEVRLNRNGKSELLIENYTPKEYLIFAKNSLN